jgi:glycosyltransferase involved in cell wall biosynthesis
MSNSLVAALRGKPVANMAVVSNPYIAKVPKITARQLATNEGERLVVACGRLDRVKGFDILIEAFGLVSRQIQNARLIILGDGAERASLEAQVFETGLTDIVSIVGYDSDVESWFRIADVGVISSRSEGFPNVILEMMASGTKTIVSTPCSDGVNDLPDVSVCPDFSPQELARYIVLGLRGESRSAIYEEYIREERTVGAYWKKIVHALNSQ